MGSLGGPRHRPPQPLVNESADLVLYFGAVRDTEGGFGHGAVQKLGGFPPKHSILSTFNCNIFQNLPQCFETMIAEARQARIEAYLQKVEFASLEELAREVGASISTVRRDVTQLETTGNILRTHGGARLASGAGKPDEFAFAALNARQTAEKEAIARACAALISPNQTVILDAGSTVYRVAEEIADRHLQIITNSLPVANRFASSPNTEVVVCGGVIYPRLGVLVGPQAVDTFSRMHADVAILGASGISAEGFFNSHALLIDMQRAILRAARRVIFCLDHSKFDRRSMFFLCDFSRPATIVTDTRAPAAMVDLLRSRGLDVVQAEAGSHA